MSRRGIPEISPIDLQDHATDVRIDRIWKRIDADLDGSPSFSSGREPRRIAGVWAIAAAATFSAFGIGVWVGDGAAVQDEDTSASADTKVTPDARTHSEVFAAGREAKTFRLPGGQHITLEPGTSVEVDYVDGEVVSMELMNGSAAIDTKRGKAFPIVAGQARLSSAAGSVLSITRNQNDMDIRVDNGSVDLTAPDGHRTLHRGDRADRVPIVTTTAKRDVPSDFVPGPFAMTPASDSLEEGSEEIDAIEEVASVDWRQLKKANRWKESEKALVAEYGSLENAFHAMSNAEDLGHIGDFANGALRKEISLRLVNSFPGTDQAKFAAYFLESHYRDQGLHEEAKRYGEMYKGVVQEDEVTACQQLEGFASQPAFIDAHIQAVNRFKVVYPEAQCEAVQVILDRAHAQKPTEEPSPPEGSESPAKMPASKAPPAPNVEDGTYE